MRLPSFDLVSHDLAKKKSWLEIVSEPAPKDFYPYVTKCVT